ncbi:SspB-related isopeptide-forming adhesin [Streptococcus hyointestinalis]|uniref:SspB-related isopeptide-forming adhesin n=1 Tax=Streptococcus hyointestinalis TaxID=1337 RepID=UPI003D06711B
MGNKVTTLNEAKATHKGHGYLRKTKIGLASGIAIASTVVFATANVSADEVTATQTTDNAATNLVSAQETTSDANLSQQASAGAQEGSITTPVQSSSLDSAVTAAHNTGVEVAQDNTVTYEEKSQADTDLTQQEEKVEAATETQKEVDQTVANAESAAKDAGVNVTPTETVTYKDDNAAAVADANKQAANLETATEAQKEISATLPQAVATAKDAGVTVSVAEGVSYSDAKKAIEDLTKQVAALNTARDTQRQIDSALALAVAEAKKSGLNITTGATTTTSDVQKALADLKAQLETLSNAEKAQSAANKTIDDAKLKAATAGTTVNNTGTVTVSADEAQNKANEIANNIANVISKNGEITKANEEAQKDYEEKVKTYEANKATATSANEVISNAVTIATAAGTTVKNTGAVTVSASEATAKANEIATAIANTVAKNKDITKANEDAQKEYEEKVKAYEANKATVTSANATITNAAAAATAAGTTVKDGGTVTVSASEASAKAKEIANEIAKVVAKNAEINKANEEAQKAYEDAKKAVDSEKAAKLAEYNKALAEMQAELDAVRGKDGYLSQDLVQSLVFDSEPNATAVVESPDGEKSEVVNDVYNLNHKYFIAKGQTLKVTYTNLENSSYNGTKISKVVYTYTALTDNGDYVFPFKDPTQTLNHNAGGDPYTTGKSALAFTAQFFDKDGNVISFSKDAPALIAINSMNNTKNYSGTGYGESITDLGENTEFIKINGSSVDYDNGVVYSATDNAYVSAGSRYEANPLNNPNEYWDSADSPLRWYGAGVLKVTSGDTISFTIQNVSVNAALESLGQQWFAFSSKVAAPTLPTPPEPEKRLLNPEKPQPMSEAVAYTLNVDNPEPEKPTPKPLEEAEYKTVNVDNPEPDKPDPTPLKEAEAKNIVVTAETHDVTVGAETHAITMTANTHDVVIATSVHPVEVKQTPSNTKSVTNTENVDINKQLVSKGSTVDWKLSNESLKAARDYTVGYNMSDALPSGFTLDLQATAAASPAYTLSYNAETRTLLATATADTLYAMNADLTKTYDVPLVTVIGTVDNDAATYKNTFTTTVSTADTVIRDDKGNVTPNGKTSTYKKTSNTVVVYTPGSDVRTYNGNVVVRYFEEGTNVKIAPNQIDLEDAKVGTSYDTTDQKQETIAYNGKLYKITSKVVGNEQGKVTDGTTYVDYFYKEVEQEEGKGNVVVHYINEDGETISNDVVDSENVPTGSDYDTTDHKPTTIKTEDGIEYSLVPTKTIGDETGKVTEGTTEITYVYKRVTPKPETPTPNDNTISPVKHIYNKDGQQIDGVTILPNSKVYYTATYDADQFKGMTATAADIAKGFALIDDIEDNTVTLDVDNAVVTIADGSVQNDLTVKYYNSIDEAPAELQTMLSKSGTKVDGNFVAVVPKDGDYTAFYNKYIKTGTSFYVTLPVITGDYTGTFKNHVSQIAFGNGYDGNIVENNIPKLEALKDAVEAVGSSKSLANGVVALNQVFPYELDGPAIATNVEGGLVKYVINDDFDETHDRYDGVFYAFAQQKLELKDGTIINVGDEITRYVTQNVVRNEDGTITSVSYSFNSDFLASLKVSADNLFDPVIYMQVTRIAYGDNVENKFEVVINDYVVESNTVVTHTPEPTPETPTTPSPETPSTPVTPTPAEDIPVQKAALLPETGEKGGTASAVAGFGVAALSVIGLAYTGKKKKGHN